MAWQDDPVVASQPQAATWTSDPVVSAAQTPDQPWWQNYENAAIKAPIKAVAGTLQLANDIGEALPGGSQEQGDANRALSGKVLDTVDKQYPTQSGFASWLGSTIADPRNAIAGVVKGPVALGAAMGGAMGLTEADSNDSGLAQRLKFGAVDAASGAAGGKIFGDLIPNVLGGAESSLTPEQQRLAQVLASGGVNLDAAQQTGSPLMNGLKAGFGSIPWTAGGEAANKMTQYQQFTKAALQKAGISGDLATPDVLDAAAKDFGNRFTTLTSKYDMPVTNDLVKESLGALGDYASNTPPSMMKPGLENIVNDVTKGQSIPGSMYQSTRSKLGGMITDAYRAGDGGYAQALGRVQDAMDDAMSKNMTPADAAALQDLRGDYGNFKTITKAMGQPTIDTTGGYIPPSRLANAVASNNRAGYTRGGGDLNDLARAGVQFLGGKIPDSGTPIRQGWQKILTGGAAGAAGLGEAYHVGGLPAAVTSAAAGVGLPLAAQKAYYTPFVQNWIKDGLVDVSPQTRQLAAMLAAHGAASVGQ